MKFYFWESTHNQFKLLRTHFEDKSPAVAAASITSAQRYIR